MTLARRQCSRRGEVTHPGMACAIGSRQQTCRSSALAMEVTSERADEHGWGVVHRSRDLPLSLILIGGPSGVGKSRFGHALARRTASTVAQVDDLQVALETLVPPERLPEDFVPSRTYLRTDSPQEINDAIEDIARFFAPAVLAAVVNRLESGTPTVFEGDFISPDVAAEARALGVRSLFLLASETGVTAMR